MEEALAHIKEAIELHIDGLKEEGNTIPKDEGFVLSRVEVTIS